MNGFIDAGLHESLKEKRVKQLKEKKVSKGKQMEEYVEEELEMFLRKENRKKFNPKPPKNFRNNQKRFQYDYEEDFYEPDYGDEIDFNY